MLASPELTLFLAGVVAAAAVLDIRSGRIPNGLIVLIAGLGIIAQLAMTRSPVALLAALGGISAGIFIWIGPFAVRWVGAADVKLVAAIGAWMGAAATFRLSLYAGLAGGLMALGYLAFSRSRGAVELVQLQLAHFRVARRFLAGSPGGAAATGRGMPYAVAILAGLLVEVYLKGWLL